MQNNKMIHKAILFSLVIILVLLSFFIIRPIILSIIFGLFFAYIFHPVFTRLHKVTRNKTISIFILMVLLIILITVPLLFLIPTIIQQTIVAYNYVQTINFGQLIQNIFPGLVDDSLANTMSSSMVNFLTNLFSNFLNTLTGLLMNFPSFLLQFTVFLFTFFYSLRDSERLKEYVSSLSPVSKATNTRFLLEFRNVTNAVIFGQFLVGLIQGLLLGLALILLKVPGAIILTFIAMVAGIIPIVGPWLVWFPIALFLLFSERFFAGAFIFIYGAFFVSAIDNFLRPMLVSKRTNLPVAISLVGMIGGLYSLGLIGLILGPLVLSYLIILIEFYRKGRLDELFIEEDKQ